MFYVVWEKLENFDRTITLGLNGSDSLFIDYFAVTATATTTWIPFALAFMVMIFRANKSRDFVCILLAVTLCVLLADQIASGIFKPLFARYRPSQDPSMMHLVDIVNGYRGGKYGFFSSHASNTVALATFSSLLVRHRSFTVGVFSWVLLNCWTRIYLGVHFVGDILAGVVCGLLVGVSVYFLLVRCLSRTQNFSNNLIQTPSGYTHLGIGWVLVVLLLSFIYCVVAGFVLSGL